MNNTDKLLLEISRMRDCLGHYESNFEFSFSDFKKDWLEDKYQDWRPALEKIKLELTQLLSDVEKAKTFSFRKSMVSKEEFFPFSQVHSYPKKLSPIDDFPFGEDVIIESREEEKRYWLKVNVPIISVIAETFQTIIDECLEYYEENKFSSPYLPKLIPSDRIPFYGNKDTFILFSYLMSKSGFFMTNNNLNLEINKTLGDSWEGELKDILIQKNKFATTLANAFYCVDHDPESKKWKELSLDSSIKNKLNEGQKERGMGDREFFIERLKQVLKELGYVSPQFQ